MKNINWGADFNLLYARYYSKYLVDGKEYNQTLNEFKYSNIINPTALSMHMSDRRYIHLADWQATL